MRGKFEQPRNHNHPPRNDNYPSYDESQPSRSNSQPPRNNQPPRRRRRHRRRNRLPLILLVLVLIAALVFGGYTLVKRLTAKPNTPNTGTSVPVETTDSGSGAATDQVTEAPTEPKTSKISTATITATGDILMHKPVINTGYSNNTYNFDSIFTYVNDYVTSADYAVANLETTLAGTKKGYQYSGYPTFNCPDEIVDSAKTAGFDMLLTSNNHCNDTSTVGINRTPEVIADKGLAYLGTSNSSEEADYRVIDVNGIKIGMVCYTYATGGTAELPSLNGIPMRPGDENKVNSFNYNNLDRFYNEMTTHIADMKAAGAEAVVLYMHWGEEYQLKPNSHQTTIAQKMCDLGVDVIVGGHPHVIQPMDLLTSNTDPDHKMLCLYSMGNAVSNQRRHLMNLNTGHTEDGVLFSFTFAKYSDGSVILESTDILPTWVYLRSGSPNQYNILPLDKKVTDWKTTFNIGDDVYKLATASYDRTMALVGDGLTKANTYLSGAQQAKEAAYENAAPAASENQNNG